MSRLILGAAANCLEKDAKEKGIQHLDKLNILKSAMVQTWQTCVVNTHHHTFNVQYIHPIEGVSGCVLCTITPSSWKLGFSSTWCTKSSHLRRICRKIRCGSPPRSHSDSQPDQETISLSARKSWKKSFSSWCLRAVRNHSPGLCKDLHRLIPIADLFLHTTPDPLSWKVRWPGNSGMRKKTFVLWGWYQINYRMIWYWHISYQIHIRWFIWWYLIELLMLYNVQMIYTHVIDCRPIGLYSRYDIISNDISYHSSYSIAFGVDRTFWCETVAFPIHLSWLPLYYAGTLSKSWLQRQNLRNVWWLLKAKLPMPLKEKDTSCQYQWNVALIIFLLPYLLESIHIAYNGQL